MDDQSRNDDQPYMVDELGETVWLRPNGCPDCGEALVTVHARSCWRCHATFEPIEPLG